MVSMVPGICHAAGSTVDDTIPLQAYQTGPRTVELTWGLAVGSTTIYRQFSDESQYVAIGNTTGNSWTDHQNRSVCGDTVRYSISNGADEGYASTVVSDNEPTSPARWGVVTVDQNTQKIMLQWEASADTDIMGYLICEGTPSMAIDTVFGRGTTQYVYEQGDPEEEYLFRICAFDSCRQASALTDAGNNMVLMVSGEPCSHIFVATWNRYNNMPSGVARYELWVKEDDAQYHIAGQRNGDESPEIQFEVGESTMQLSIYVKVMSVDGQSVAYSNRIEQTLGTVDRPEYLYLRKVSVNDNGSEVTVIAQTDPTYEGTDYRVYRRVKQGAWTLAGHCSPTNNGELVWKDTQARPTDEVYTYRMGVYDGCGRNEIFTLSGSTIKPIMEQRDIETVLVWNEYEGWEGTTLYEVMSGTTDNITIWETEGSTTATEWSIENNDRDGMRYKIVAVEGVNSRYRRNDTLQSVTVAYRPHTDIWMPTAFTPLESTNNTVKPFFRSVMAEGYSFSIYDRMGMLLFSTTDRSEAWDGYCKGRLQPSGAYVYKITYRQNDNTDHYLIGTLMLIY